MRVRVSAEYYRQLTMRRSFQQAISNNMDTGEDDDIVVVYDSRQVGNASTNSEGKSDYSAPPSASSSTPAAEPKLPTMVQSTSGTNIPVINQSFNGEGDNTNGNRRSGRRVQPPRACQVPSTVVVPPAPPKRNSKKWSLILKEVKKAEALRRKEEEARLLEIEIRRLEELRAQRKREMRKKQSEDFHYF